jgi:Fe2+ transport system protein B
MFFYTLYEKVRAFVFGAGKIILLVSIILWFLASFGPKQAMEQAVNVATIESALLQSDKATTDLHIASKKLEASYAGYAGRFIEPVIKPLGFDWKIGIALITSFAAREVFVGTISTLYSIGKEADNMTIKQKLQQEKNADGKPVFYNGGCTVSSAILFVCDAVCKYISNRLSGNQKLEVACNSICLHDWHGIYCFLYSVSGI